MVVHSRCSPHVLKTDKVFFLCNGATDGLPEHSTAEPRRETTLGRAVPTGGSVLPVATYVSPANDASKYLTR
jgi:hypothetical protein